MVDNIINLNNINPKELFNSLNASTQPQSEECRRLNEELDSMDTMRRRELARSIANLYNF